MTDSNVEQNERKALREILKIAVLELEHDDKLRARAARTLNRIADLAEAALTEKENRDDQPIHARTDRRRD